MINIRIIWVLSLLLVSAFSVAANVKIGLSHWPPYYDKSIEGYGSEMELINAVFSSLNQKVTPVWYRTGMASIVNLNIGELDASAGWECNKERAIDFLFSAPIGVEEIVFFHRKDVPFNWNKIEDLNQEITIGVTAKHAYGDIMSKLLTMDKVTIQLSGSDKRNMDKLFHKEIDLFIADKRVGLTLLKQAEEPHSKQITFHDKPIRGKVASRLLFSRKKAEARELLTNFNRALAQLRQQRKLTELDPENFAKCPHP